MTYPNATPKHNDDDDKVDEASLLLTIATAAPAASFSFGHEGMLANTKMNGGAPMRTNDDRNDVFRSRILYLLPVRGLSA